MWSKTKKALDDRLAASLKKRVRYGCEVYTTKKIRWCSDMPVFYIYVDGEMWLATNLMYSYDESIAHDELMVLDGELRETQTANYFSDVYPIDCTVSPANALFCRKNGTLLQAGNLL